MSVEGDLDLTRTLAVGFIPPPISGVDPCTRADTRAAVRDGAHTEGVCLADIYEPGGTGPDQMQVSVQALQALACLHEARTVVTTRPADERVQEMARATDLRVLTVLDPGRPENDRAPSEQEPWVGTLAFDLAAGRTWRVCTVELDVQPEIVTVTIATHHVTDLRRDRFHRWLQHPDLPFQVQGLGWSAQPGGTYLTIDGSIPYPVPGTTLTQLRAVI